MTHEEFNLLLAVGGGVTVPTLVGVVATILVHRGDRLLGEFLWRNRVLPDIPLPEVSDDNRPAAHTDEPIHA